MTMHPIYAKVAGPLRASPTTPIVILEAGLGDMSYSWTVVFREIAKFARVFSYDRDGYGRSRGGSHPSHLHQPSR
ncbi:hypothetical protein MRB53_039818 [Persea americana]|nr:hypothetical protein MRB53_039818 [Persea americana]